MVIKKRIKTAGFLLIISAITFWISWFLMPDQGTVDTVHILNVVQKNRDSVFTSVIVQIFSSVLYIPALFLLATGIQTSRTTNLAVILLSIGAMGMCMDAFFHLMAYFMTDAAINPGLDVILLMKSVQTKGVMILAPLLLSFFIGSLILGIALKNQNLNSKIPIFIFTGAFVVAIIGAIIVNTMLKGEGRGILVLTVLAIFASGQIVSGIQLLRTKGG